MVVGDGIQGDFFVILQLDRGLILRRLLWLAFFVVKATIANGDAFIS